MNSESPNILFLFTDQQRLDTIGALGNPIIRTPVLDRLCAGGTAFTRCYTPCPVCVPARAAMVTGLPPHQTGCCHNGSKIDESIPSFMQRLTECGYQTHGIGKMHFTPSRTRMWGFESRDVSERREDDDYRRFLDENGFGYILEPHGALSEMFSIPQVSQMPAHLHESSWVADRSIDFLRRRDRSRPFFLWSSFFSPHPPFAAPVPWNKIYRAAEMLPPRRTAEDDNLITFWNRVQDRADYRDRGFDEWLMRTIKAMYYASISFVDYNIGRILQALGDEIENTLIVFTSDHGELLGDYGCLGKRSMVDASSRVPLIVRWPDGGNAGSVYDEPVSLLDIHPTLLNAAGHEEPRVHEEGRDLAGILNGEARDRMVFSQYRDGGFGVHMAVRKSRKYVFSAPDQREWLFDLDADPRETHDFGHNAMYAEDLASLRQALFRRYRADGYTNPLEDAGWRCYPKRAMAANPDVGLSIQHPERLQAELRKLGPYAPDRLPPEMWLGKAASSMGFE